MINDNLSLIPHYILLTDMILDILTPCTDEHQSLQYSGYIVVYVHKIRYGFDAKKQQGKKNPISKRKP